MEIVINELETVMIQERLEQLRKKRKENRQVKKWTLKNFEIEKECNEAIERFEGLLRKREEAVRTNGVQGQDKGCFEGLEDRETGHNL